MAVFLTPSDAVGALVVNLGGQVLLQLRDNKPDIFFPDTWGTFGGGVEAGETPEMAMIRELREELGVDFSAADLSFFTEFTFDFAPWGHGVVYRKYYLVDAGRYAPDDFTLGEGKEFRYFDLGFALSGLKIIPYDAFALWMYDATRKATT